MLVTYVSIIIILLFGVIITLRFYQLGMTVTESIVHTFYFPFQIVFFHIKIFKLQQAEKMYIRILTLLMPIFNLSDTIVIYAYSCIELKVEKAAILKMLEQTEETKREETIQQLVEKGYLVKRESNVHKKENDTLVTDNNNSEYVFANKSNFYTGPLIFR